MIGLDTNVLLRAATRDDPRQSPIARRVLRALTPVTPGYINMVVLAEFAWTLKRSYRYRRSDICSAVRKLMASSSIVMESRAAVNRAIARSDDDGLEFADALICELNLGAACTSTVTFDQRANHHNGFSSPK